MYLLDIFNDDFVIVAETLAIVLGSMLMGIFLSYLFWSGYKKRITGLSNSLDLEREQAEELKNQLRIQLAVKGQLQNEIIENKSRLDAQSKKIFDQQQLLFDQQARLQSADHQLKNQKTDLENLNSSNDQYRNRLNIVEDEFLNNDNPGLSLKRTISDLTSKDNYDYVSQLLGYQVTENDLTIIMGIDANTASVLNRVGIERWEQLAETGSEQLRQILVQAGDPSATLDPANWPMQARMAALGEWRKLKIFQQTQLRNDQQGSG